MPKVRRATSAAACATSAARVSSSTEEVLTNMRTERTRAAAASLASSLLILSFGLAPITNAADHLDSPKVAENGRGDITDLYVFSGKDGNGTVFVLGVNPGAGALPNSPTTFGSKIDYLIKVDTNGDAKADIKYMYKFGKPNNMGVQRYDLWRNDTWLAGGLTGTESTVIGGGRTTAGLFDDPFFFDLDAFKGAVLGNGNGRTFCDGNTHDFFLGLNISALVLKVPNSSLGGNGQAIGVWATTVDSTGHQLDQMGRPAINTVFNNVETNQSDRQKFNETSPIKQVGRGYRSHVEDVLTALGAADPNGLAGVLIPDIMTYTTGNTDGFLNGRRLSDDVIDAELEPRHQWRNHHRLRRQGQHVLEQLPVPRGRQQLSASKALTRNSGIAEGRSPGLRAGLGRTFSRVHRFRYLALPLVAVLIVAAVQLWPRDAASNTAPASAVAAAPAPAAAADPLTDITPTDQIAPVAGVDTSDTDRRIAFWQDRLREQPQSDTAWSYLADLYELKGRQTGDLANFTSARDSYQRALDIAPLSTLPRLGLARIHSTFHEFDDAMADATTVLEQNPSANSALAIIFDAAYELGDLHIATDALSKLDSRVDSPAVTIRQAKLAFVNGDGAGAQTLATQAVTEADARGEEGAGLAFYDYAAAEYALLAGDLDAAKSGYDAALQELPGYALALAGEGRVAFARGDTPGAISYLERAVAAVPRPDLVAYLGSLYELSGNRPAADEQYATVEFIAGLSATGSQRVYDREYSLFLADHGGDAAVAVDLAQSELETRQDVYGYDTAAWALHAAGRNAEAMRTMSSAMALGTPDAKLLIHAGLIELANGTERRRSRPHPTGPRSPSLLLAARDPGGPRSHPMNRPSLRMSVRVAAAFALALSTVALVVPAASAHPLGNFTINHYSELRVATDAVLVDHVTDYAEIPTFSERRQMDTDGDGNVSAAEAAAFESARCASLATQLHLSAAGSTLPLETVQSGLSFPMGQGSVTMRLVCVYRAALATGLAAAATFTFEDVSYAERQGWREIVVRGDGTTLENSDAPTMGTSDRLTHYPSDLLSIPLGQSEATFGAVPGGPALEPFSVPDASPVGVPAAEPAIGDPPPAAVPAEPAPAPAISAPAGVTELGSDITALFQSPDLTPPIIALSLLVAVALGAFHAVSPGHGKTVMAAYLVGSRGNMRHAVGLGLTVTVSHTLGVLALGALSLSAAALIPPERLYPILSVVSGAIVVVIGSYLLVTRLRSMYVSRREAREHAAAHEHGLEHEHGHHHSATASSSDVARPAGWHEHDGIGHTHLPPEGIGRRGLFALGLSGGMVPSVSALLILIGSISIGRPAFGIVLTIAFGLGMAFVLVGVGLALVYARRFVERFPAATPLRLSPRLPLVTAVIVLVAGLLIAGQGLTALG